MGNYKITKAGYIVIVIILVIIASGVYFAIGNKTEKADIENNSEGVNSQVLDIKSDIKMEEIEELNKTIDNQKNIIDTLETQLEKKDEKIDQMEDVLRQSSCSIYFRPNDFSISNQSKKSILKFVKQSVFLDESTKIVVEGNVYSSKENESQDYGLLFSLKRAESVASYLKEMGIVESRLKIIGNGSSKPHYYDSTHKSRELSRFVKISFE